MRGFDAKTYRAVKSEVGDEVRAYAKWAAPHVSQQDVDGICGAVGDFISVDEAKTALDRFEQEDKNKHGV